jgi:pimeloyl-ACP methyl ester carboxylesterase
VVEQAVDRGRNAAFVKELVITDGPVPLSMVRKRSAESTRAGGTIAPLLLVHGFGQNRYAWHLPSRSLANHLASLGYDVFNLDLRGHGRSRHLSRVRARSLDDYIDEDLPRALDEVFHLSGRRPAFFLGHSLGGLVSYAAAPQLNQGVAGILTLGSPYHFTRGSRSLQALALVARGLSAVKVRPHNLPLAVSSIGSMLRTLGPVTDTPLYPIPVRGWRKGALEPAVLEEHLRLAFDRAMIGELVEMLEWANERQFGGRATDRAERFEALDKPLLVISGKHDDLAPPESVRPAFDRSRSSDKTYRSIDAGHIDLLVGRDAPRGVWNTVGSWISRRLPD